MAEREPGLYRVKLSANDDWRVAEWVQYGPSYVGAWYVIGAEVPFHPDEVSQVGERISGGEADG